MLQMAQRKHVLKDGCVKRYRVKKCSKNNGGGGKKSQKYDYIICEHSQWIVYFFILCDPV